MKVHKVLDTFTVIPKNKHKLVLILCFPMIENRKPISHCKIYRTINMFLDFGCVNKQVSKLFY